MVPIQQEVFAHSQKYIHHVYPCVTCCVVLTTHHCTCKTPRPNVGNHFIPFSDSTPYGEFYQRKFLSFQSFVEFAREKMIRCLTFAHFFPFIPNLELTETLVV
jgi:hypothetical protein